MSNDLTPEGLSRRNFIWTVGAATATAAVGLGLSACSTVNGSPAGALSSAKARRGGQLRVAEMSAGAAETVSPATATQYPDFFRVFNLFDCLWTRDAKGAPQLGLLASGTPNQDATLWTLRLRDGIVFHNGKPATADDLLYTINSWRDARHLANGIASQFVRFDGVKKVDKLTVQVPLTVGVTEFPSLMTRMNFALIPQGANPFTNKIGTGPFVFGSFQPGLRSVFTANKNYWVEGQPYVDELVIDSSFTDDQARYNALLANQVDIVPRLPYAQAKAQSSAGQIQVLNAPSPTFFTFPMNCQVAPYNDVRVRQALKLIIDRKQMVDTIFDGFGTVGNDLSPINQPYFASDLVVEQDIDKGKALLKAAGKEGFTVNLTTSDSYVGQSESSVLLQEQLAKAGVSVNFNRISGTNFYTTQAGWLSYPISADNWISTTSSITQMYTSMLSTKGAFNQTHWATPATDKLLYDAMSDTNPGSATDKWHTLQQQQFDTGGYITWGQSNNVDGLSNKVGGVAASGAGSVGFFKLGSAFLSA